MKFEDQIGKSSNNTLKTLAILNTVSINVEWFLCNK